MKIEWPDREAALRVEMDKLRNELLRRCARLGPEIQFLEFIVCFLECVWQEKINTGFFNEARGIREAINALKEIGNTSQREG